MVSNDQGEDRSHGLGYNCADNFGFVSDTEANATEAHNMIAKPNDSRWRSCTRRRPSHL